MQHRKKNSGIIREGNIYWTISASDELKKNKIQIEKNEFKDFGSNYLLGF